MPFRTAWQLVVGGALLATAACGLNRGGLNPDAARPQPRDGGMDGGSDCRDCNDPYDCTVDTCVSGSCAHVPDDRLCGMDRICDPGMGCVSAACNAFNCQPRDGCERAECIGDECSRSPACTATEMCCGGECAAIGCNDGNPCTMDGCAGARCDNIPMAGAICDNGIFCDGPDSCDGDGNCIYSEDPCPGMSMCDETMRTCTGCVSDDDCPGDITGPWTACGGFDGTCDESGTETRVITTFTCRPGGVCELGFVPESRGCGRETDGTLCGMETCDPFPPCGYTDVCDESAPMVIRTCRTPLCAGSSCLDSSRAESMMCTRDRDGLLCDDGMFCNGVDRCVAESCNHPGNPCTTAPRLTCVEMGDRCVQCTMTSECNDSNPCTTDNCTMTGLCTNTNHTGPCDDGVFCNGIDTCSMGVCTHPGACLTPPATMCDEGLDRCYECTGAAMCNDSNPCTDDACTAGLCVRTNNMNPCNDGMYCTRTDVCSGGTCGGSGDTCFGRPCDEGTDCCGCSSNPHCDDLDDCTADSCSSSCCVRTPVRTCMPADCAPSCTGTMGCLPTDTGSMCECRCR